MSSKVQIVKMFGTVWIVYCVVITGNVASFTARASCGISSDDRVSFYSKIPFLGLVTDYVLHA